MCITLARLTRVERVVTRSLATIGALSGWAGLAIQLYILMTGPLGPIGGLWRFIAFFTVLMNLFAACLFTIAVFKPDFSPARARLQTASTAYMTMVGATYILILERLWDPQGLQLIADKLLHYAAPAAAVIFWLVCVPKSALKWSDTLRWTGVPLLYLVYALARASVDGFYPYFFIDVGQLGWPKVALNAGGMLLAFLALGLIFVAIGKMLSLKSSVAAKA
jgi:hypothetical protein